MIECHGGAQVQGGASGDRQERVPKCIVRELQGERRPHPTGQAPLGHRRTRRVRARDQAQRSSRSRGLDVLRPARIFHISPDDEHTLSEGTSCVIMCFFLVLQYIFAASFHVIVSSTTRSLRSPNLQVKYDLRPVSLGLLHLCLWEQKWEGFPHHRARRRSSKHCC